MIAYTVPQAADRVDVTVDVIEQWILSGFLVAVRNPIDGHRYIEETHLLHVDRDVHLGVAHPAPEREPLPIPQLAHWLWGRGHPTTEAAIRHWIYRDKTLRSTVPSGGRGRPALYDPIDALAVAIRMCP